MWRTNRDWWTCSVGRQYRLLYRWLDGDMLQVEDVGSHATLTCDSNNVLLVVDLAHAMHVLSVQPVGETPDVLAFDTDRQLLYVACESGVVSVFQEQGHAVREVGDQFVAPEAHSIAVDQQTHQVYLPLEAVGGRPVLRIAVLSLAQRRVDANHAG